MSGCECYQIGGPFISFDPDCPAHGLEAQREAREAEEEREAREARIAALERRVSELEDELRRVRSRAGVPPPRGVLG